MPEDELVDPAQDLSKNLNFNDGAGFRFQASSIMALQEASEQYLVGLFEDTRASRLTLT